MKTYISVGIGDMVRLDSILTQKERNNITEIYWACRFGHCLIPLLQNNEFYPNLRKQYVIDDEVGRGAMLSCDHNAVNFWHFRPDFSYNYEVGLSLFGLNRDEVNALDAANMFRDSNRKFINSSFLESLLINNVEVEFNKDKQGYILVHYPTSTRPRSDIATMEKSDWDFIRNLAKEKNLPIYVITDSPLNTPINDLAVFLNPPIRDVIQFAKNATYYAGCDSFVSILACKVLPPERLFVKSHNPNIKNSLLDSNNITAGYFQPHSPEVVAQFYKSYIG